MKQALSTALRSYEDGIDSEEQVRKGVALACKALAVIGIGVGFAAFPCPAELEPNVWYVLAIFLASIAGIILQLTPIGCISFVALALIAGLNLAPTSKVLASFASPTAWMILCAFLLAKGLQKTGLGKRIALKMISFIGTSTMGLAYALTFSEMLIGAAMPSITARSGGIMFPIARGLCDVYDSQPGETARRLGSFLMQLGNQNACIVSAMFMTGMASNLLIVDLARKTAGTEILWMSWFIASVVPGCIALVLIPYILVRLDKPEITKTPAAPRMADEHLREMGPLRGKERIMLGVFAGVLILWASSGLHSVNATTVAMGAIAVLLVTGVLTWDDCLKETSCWDSFFWIAALMQMAALIAEGGAPKWFVSSIAPVVETFSWQVTLLLVALLYVYIQYFFASLTAHITALYAPFLLLCIAGGAPPMLAALVLAMFSSLCGGLTNYSGAHSPVWFGSGFVPQRIWWRNGFICSLFNMAIFLGIGSVWWKICNLY